MIGFSAGFMAGYWYTAEVLAPETEGGSIALALVGEPVASWATGGTVAGGYSMIFGVGAGAIADSSNQGAASSNGNSGKCGCK